MMRDHTEDVRRLNYVLNRNGDAGLEDMPPVPFTGDIDAMESGNCVCVLGINPHWPTESRDAHQNEIIPFRKMVSALQEGGSDTTNHSSIQDLVISEEKWLIGSITNRSDQGTQSISFMGNLTKAYGSETHSP